MIRKRLRAESPSNMGVEGETVAGMNAIDLKSIIQGSVAETMDEKLKTLPTKEDFEQISLKVDGVSEKLNALSTENQMLKDQIKMLEEAKSITERRLIFLEDAIKKNNIIIRGMDCQQSAYKAVQKLLKDKLKIKSDIDIVSTKKIYANEKMMTVKAELKNEKMVSDVMKHTKNLSGSSIFIELDLNSERLQTKKIMLKLKNEILEINKNKRILVRNDRIRVGDKWLHWNKEKMLVCDKEGAEKVLKEMYGEEAAKIDISYKSLLTKINSKN